jgi:hypothetical protein
MKVGLLFWPFTPGLVRAMAGAADRHGYDMIGGVTAGLPTIGTWPVAGATVNLFPLRRAAEASATGDVELIAVDEAVLVPTARGHVSLPLLDFGPTGLVPPPRARPDRHSDLPLFVWASRCAG